MKLSEYNIIPIWDSNKKIYTNTISKKDIEEILFKGIKDTKESCKYGILLGISRKTEAIARAKEAAKIYKEGRIEKILITGRKNGISSIGKNQTPLKINLNNPSISEIFADEYY